MRMLTLVVMELVAVMAVQFVQELHDIGVGIGPAEGVPSAVEAEDKLVWLFGLVRNGGNHPRRDGDTSYSIGQQRKNWKELLPSLHTPLVRFCYGTIHSARHHCGTLDFQLDNPSCRGLSQPLLRSTDR